MFKNYALVALRTLRKHLGYSTINITGLAVGMACCLLIFSYIHHEQGYDQHHPDADRIYRIYREAREPSGAVQRGATTPYRLTEMVQENIPQAEAVVRLAKNRRLFQSADHSFSEPRFFLADSSVFDVFAFDFLRGDVAALREPYSLVLTASTAQKYFGDRDPLGQTLLMDNEHAFTITAVVADLPVQSHFHFDLLASIESTKDRYSRTMFESMGAVWTYTYVRLTEGSAPGNVEAQLDQMLAPLLPPGFDLQLKLQPLTDIHLHSDLGSEIEANGDARTVFAFGLIAAFILLIACINFMNLATARSAWRAKEVGVRKVVGAYRGRLIGQFLGESVLMSVLAGGLALGLAYLLLPLFNHLTGTPLTLALTPGAWAAGVALVLGVGLLAGSYPAFYLSAFRPAQVLKGRGAAQAGSVVWLRKGLVTFQFAITICLFIGTAVVYQQLGYMQEKRLGFDKEQVVVLPLRGDARENPAPLRQTLLQEPAVANVSVASNVPPDGLNRWWIKRPGTPQEDAQLTRIIAADPDYVATLGLTLAAGRNFDRSRPADLREGILLNEAAVRSFGLDDPLGQQLEMTTVARTGTVIGVVEDFHFASLHETIQPVVLVVVPGWNSKLAIRLRPGDLPGTLAMLERRWEQHVPDWPFAYSFLDESFDAQYRAEQRLSEALGAFAGLAILIACLGLLGLIAFAAERRTKEIGVRKVLGASVPHLVGLLTREFVGLVGVAFLVAAPLAYFAMTTWLEGFAYRIDVGLGTLVLAGVGAIVLAGLTVSYQALRAAMGDPIRALRYE